MTKIAVVTGAGRGIGRAITDRLSRDDWTVYATVRSHAHLDELSGLDRVVPVMLDITDDDAGEVLTKQIPGRIDALINNAGYAVTGPLETISPEQMTMQLATNVVGHQRITRTLLPNLRADDGDTAGRILFVSSLAGLFAVPGSGAYTASKYALEGLADTYRLELRRWGIGVSLIEPGTTRTDIWTGMMDNFEETVSQWSVDEKDLYGPYIRKMRRLVPLTARSAVPPDRVADTVIRALNARRPRRRYRCDLASRVQVCAMALTPTFITDRAMVGALA
ncbi:SDR family NAD(P)-dependent oxidoreductase [Rhodococcus sp. IEGM1428]|uniref:SDR family NAD(P)-dependent oxidoreductase n=1 Tax=Rhodococcus sp. IEGM1428 TaxID=3392191 RepID=UPI003D12A2D0